MRCRLESKDGLTTRGAGLSRVLEMFNQVYEKMAFDKHSIKCRAPSLPCKNKNIDEIADTIYLQNNATLQNSAIS